MPTSTNVTNLKINELTEAQYDTAVQGGVIGANEISILTDAEAGQIIQVATLPTASADELGKIYQFVGTTDANYTNGYFYKCVSDGATPAVYSWSNIQVQASSGGLPSQTGNAGKFLTTDGTDASWSDKPLVNTATGNNAITIAGSSTSSERAINIGVFSEANSSGTSVGTYARANGSNSVSIGNGSRASQTRSIAIGDASQSTSSNAIAIGYNAQSSNSSAIQIGSTGSTTTNSDANTLKVGNANGNFEIMSADGSIPSDRLVHAINKYSTMPTAASTNEGWIVQFTGTTDSTYTHGHLYECVSDGQTPATYSWTEVSMGGGSSYTAGTGIDITSGVISVTSPTLQNTATGSSSHAISTNWQLSANYTILIGGAKGNYASGVCCGVYSELTGANAVAYGSNSKAKDNSVAIGYGAQATATNSIQINANSSYAINNDANTFKVGNNNGNFEIMSADGTIPTARLTKVNSTITLAAAGWSSNSQTVNVTGMTATGVVMVSPDPTDQSAYTSAGILCTAQAAGTLTFTCDTVPSADIDVNVVML